MMKHKLRIDDLAVESFVASPGTARERGTVAAYAKPHRPTEAQTACQFTCLEDDCQPTFGQSCLQCPVPLVTVNEETCDCTAADLTCFDCTA